jgi:hypothetical protein
VRHQTLSGATPDSPVNYSGVAPRIPEGEQFGVGVPGAPDSPVNYSGVAPRIPEGEQFGVGVPGAPDTVRWCTRHCSVRQTRGHFG